MFAGKRIHGVHAVERRFVLAAIAAAAEAEKAVVEVAAEVEAAEELAGWQAELGEGC